jgi:hypothetical protein
LNRRLDELEENIDELAVTMDEIAPLPVASFSDDEDGLGEDEGGIERDAVRVSFSDDEYDDEQGLGQDEW